MSGFRDMVGFIWSVADLLRGDYKQSEYSKVILPLTVLRRLDCVLEPTKDAVVAEYRKREGSVGNLDPFLTRAAGGLKFYNTSELTFPALLDDAEHVAANLRSYIQAFSPGAVDVLEKYGFDAQISRLDEAGLLYQVVAKFAGIDLHPDVLSPLDMGYVFEELIRRFSEISNETAGEHFTPREVIRLMVNLLLTDDHDALTTPGIVKTIYDGTCGTGGMLSVAQEWVRELNPASRLEAFGQELNGETYAICRSDMMLKGQDASHIAFGNSISADGHAGRQFDYLIANPPFGVEWKKIKTFVDEEAGRAGGGRFGAGIPRINDGSFLFLQHMISKMKPASEGGSRLAIVFNGSPLFTGGAESGESNIRRWILENDLLEGIIALPDQLFYNTGISTYIWVLSNHKDADRKGKVVLLDARKTFTKMRKALGEKRKELSAAQVADVTALYADALAVAAEPTAPAHDKVKVFATTNFGYQRVTVERPMRRIWEVTDETAAAALATKQVAGLHVADRDAVATVLTELTGTRESTQGAFVKALVDAAGARGLDLSAAVRKAVASAAALRDKTAAFVTDPKGNALPDPDLRDYENVPLDEPVEQYMAREVLPFAPDAWADSTVKIGYEIPFTRIFYVYTPPRALADIDADIDAIEKRIAKLLHRESA